MPSLRTGVHVANNIFLILVLGFISYWTRCSSLTSYMQCNCASLVSLSHSLVCCLLAVMDEVQRREDEEEELTFDPDREAYYKDDPKKALKKFFDREGKYMLCINIVHDLYMLTTVHVHVYIHAYIIIHDLYMYILLFVYMCELCYI